MPYIQSQSPKEATNIYYEDYGTGKALVFVGGWPFGGNMWEYQVDHFIKKGYRCITYDRRGFGRSDYPFTGYDYDVMSEDLHAIIAHLQLEKFVLIGFSMGGGEVVRYLTRYGSDAVERIVLIGSVTPYLLKKEDNEGFPIEGIEEMINGVLKDRPAFFESFNKSFFGETVSKAYLDVALQRQMQSSLHATISCIHAFGTTDFRKDVEKINIPLLLIHGTMDDQVPIEFSAQKMKKLLPDASLIKYENHPHGVFITNREKLNKDIEKFLDQ